MPTGRQTLIIVIGHLVLMLMRRQTLIIVIDDVLAVVVDFILVAVRLIGLVVHMGFVDQPEHRCDLGVHRSEISP